MVYSEVIKNNWHLLLPKKKRYTKADVKNVMKKDNTLSEKIARFIVVCTAIFHDAEYSNWIANYNSLKSQIKRMV